MLIGPAIAVPATLLFGGGAHLTSDALRSSGISGVGNIVGLLLAYTAFQGGKVAVIAPILSTEGATGRGDLDPLRRADRDRRRDRPHRDRDRHRPRLGGQPTRSRRRSPVGWPSARDRRRDARPDRPCRRSTLLALGAVVFFGINLYASARIGATLPLVWSILPARLGGSLFVALPLLATGRLRLSRESAAVRGRGRAGRGRRHGRLCLRARDGIAVAAVTSSQFGAIAALVSVVAFGERLRRIQVVGIVVIAIGVATLAALRTG